MIQWQRENMIKMKAAKTIWMDGKFLPWEKAQVHFLTHCLHYGSGVFEGIRCYKTDKGPAIFRLEEHIDRLLGSAKIIKLNHKISKEELMEVCVEIVKQNDFDACYIRPLIFLGYGKMGLNPKGVPVSVGIAAWEWGTYLGEEALENGIHAKISSYTRGNINAVMNHAKCCGNYVNSMLSKLEVVESGYDEAIMLDPDGYVGECSAENLFTITDEAISTPPKDMVLEGITRLSILEIAKNEGITCKEEMMTRDQLYICDEAFLTGTAAEVTPISKIDDREIGTGKPGPITKRLQSIFFDAARGKEKNYENWLTYV